MKCKLIFCLLLILLATTLVVACSSESTPASTAFGTTESPHTTSATSAETSQSPITSAITTTEMTTTAPETTTAAPTVQKITPEEAKAMIDQGGITLVDVRRVDEFQDGHIPEAILVPNETILTEAAEKLPDQNAVILVYCRSGRRSAEAAEKLISLGYSRVYDFGGILDWPYDITK